MKHVFVTGGSSGIGQAICEELQRRGITYYAPTRKELDMRDFLKVATTNLTAYDTVIHCAGVNCGSYLGFESNPVENQVEQIDVNFIAGIMLIKNVVQQTNIKRFIYISSDSFIVNKPFGVVYSASKLALQFTVNTLRSYYTNIKWTEVLIGRTRTNLLYNNYLGTRTHEQVTEEYNALSCLEVSQVVDLIFKTVNEDLDYVELRP
jgi:NAD(P)-dependent dehydrogenase (short-subunit alcohol dehydrogenase family)